MSVFETKLARFRAEQERKKMSKSYRREVAKKLKDAIAEATDPKVIADLANALAKYLPKPKSPRRRPGTPVGPIKAKEPSIDDLVAALEKKRKEARKPENGGSSDVA